MALRYDSQTNASVTNGTQLTIAKPAAAQPGDLMFACIGGRTDLVSPDPAGNWKRNTLWPGMFMFGWRIVGWEYEVEPSQYTWTFNGGSDLAGAILLYKGAQPEDKDYQILHSAKDLGSHTNSGMQFSPHQNPTWDPPDNYQSPERQDMGLFVAYHVWLDNTLLSNDMPPAAAGFTSRYHVVHPGGRMLLGFAEKMLVDPPASASMPGAGHYHIAGGLLASTWQTIAIRWNQFKQEQQVM